MTEQIIIIKVKINSNVLLMLAALIVSLKDNNLSKTQIHSFKIVSYSNNKILFNRISLIKKAHKQFYQNLFKLVKDKLQSLKSNRCFLKQMSFKIWKIKKVKVW